MSLLVYVQARDSDRGYRVNYADLVDSFEFNYQISNNYEISFTMTYVEEYKEAFNAAKAKGRVYEDGKWFTIQQADTEINSQGLLTLKVTANHELIDKMKNLRLDKKEPTEDNPKTSGGGSGSGQDDNQDKPEVTIKKTAEKKTYPLKDRLDQFFNNNDQGINYRLQGNFPEVAVDCDGSLYEWLGSHLKDFSAYWWPDGNTLVISDLPSMQRKTGQAFRYQYNVTNAQVQLDANNIVNDCMVYGGKMEKDITSGGPGGGGDLDSVEGFASSPINADFGVNKQLMLQDFAAKDHRVQAWGVDVSRLYDTIKGQGISPEWFFAYDITEQDPMSWSWLNHFANRLPDPYQDAIRVCNWIKQFANSDSFTPATGFGAYASPQMTAEWNHKFGKGTIGRLYLQGTAAAVMEIANENPGRYGRPMSWCVQLIKSWGGHTVKGGDGGGWGWPFPCGEGQFMLGQTFGTHPQDGVGRGNGFHDGLDFGAYDHPGNEVHAIHGGKCIISRAWGNGGINWYCVIQDSSGLNVEYQEAFASASNITVNVGDVVKTGDVIGYRNTSHLHIGITRHNFPEAFAHAWSDDGTWLDPRQMIKTGGGASPSGDSGGSSTSTTTQTYYALSYHYENQESIKKYGRHRGKNLVMDSIYDMDQLKKYADANIQHDPPTTLTLKEIYGGEYGYFLGDTTRLIVPEMNINYDVTLMGVKFNPFKPDQSDSTTLTFNNTGLTMQNVINALYNDIKGINRNVSQFDTLGTTVERNEDHFANEIINHQNQSNNSIPKLSNAEMDRLKAYTRGEANG